MATVVYKKGEENYICLIVEGLLSGGFCTEIVALFFVERVNKIWKNGLADVLSVTENNFLC